MREVDVLGSGDRITVVEKAKERGGPRLFYPSSAALHYEGLLTGGPFSGAVPRMAVPISVPRTAESVSVLRTALPEF